MNLVKVNRESLTPIEIKNLMNIQIQMGVFLTCTFYDYKIDQY